MVDGAVHERGSNAVLDVASFVQHGIEEWYADGTLLVQAVQEFVADRGVDHLIPIGDEQPGELEERMSAGEIDAAADLAVSNRVRAREAIDFA